MTEYSNYLKEIEERKSNGLNPKPIDDEVLITDIISNIKDEKNKYYKNSLNFFIYNVLPGTTAAAKVKANFLKDIILDKVTIKDISPSFALDQLSHMKGGPSIEVLLDLALGHYKSISEEACEVLKTQVFLYEADMERLENAFKNGNEIAKDILVSYSKAEFFTNLPVIPEKIELVSFVAGIGDISTDLLSPGSDAHSRSDRELHGKCMFEHNIEQQKSLIALQNQYPNRRIMLVAEKGTMGVGSSRMSCVNNVALWIG